MAKRNNNNTSERSGQITLPNLGPVLPQIGNAEYIELAELLDTLLVDEFVHNDQRGDAPFAGTELPDDSNLLKVPTLIALLANLPILNPIKEHQELIPLVRALIPNTSFDIPNMLTGDRKEPELLLIDVLYKEAVLNDSKATFEIADRVLYRLAVLKGNNELLPRLVERFYEIELRDTAERHSLRHCVFEHAHARLKLMQLQNGTPAGRVLHTPLKNSNRIGPTIADELLHIATESSQTFLQKVQLWIMFKKQTIAEFWPAIIAEWEDEDVTSSKSERTRKMMPRFDELTSALIDLRRIQAHQITLNGSNGISDTEQLGEDKSEREVSVLDSDTQDFSSLADDANEYDAVVKQCGQPPTLVVFPKIVRTGNRELDERLKLFREELSEQPLPLIQTPDLAPIRTKLVAILPHLEAVIDRILNAMSPHRSINIPPVLLVGRPGCGKTTLAQELALLLALPAVTFDVAGVSDANFLGVDMRWNTGAAGLHLDLISSDKIANPLIIMDEIEKMGGSIRNGDARKVLMGLLEPRRSQAFFDPFLGRPIDVSAMNWIFTANTTKGIPVPFQNRIEIIRCSSPKRIHIDQLAPQLLESIYTE